MATIVSAWIDRFQQDLEPTPGRWSSSLRIVLASVIALLLLMTLRMPFLGLSMYFVFLVGRDSPAVSFRSGLLSLLALAASVAVALGVVIATDNDPMVRLLSVAMVTFVAGMFMLSSTLPALGSTFGFVYCTLIAMWETRYPAGTLVKQMLYLLGSISISIGSVVAVEYIFASRHPAEDLQRERITRYSALEDMFRLYVEGADSALIHQAVARVSRLAAIGQGGMQRLYNTIVERNLDTGSLPIGTRVRITMLAQLMDLSAAFGWQHPSVSDPDLRQRCAHIAEFCRYMSTGTVPPDRRQELLTERRVAAYPSLFERVEGMVHSILDMPVEGGAGTEKTLVALPSVKIPLLVPGAIRQPQTIAYALKISLCATVCYIIYWAIAWPGISTAVTTVMITGLSTSAATKQKLIFRVIGSIIGGLILGISATAFLLPHMDSITSLVVLVVAVALLSAWVSGGTHFNYIGLQMAFSFYLVVFEGFSAPTELAPARDRFMGILLALVVMAFVFDQLWPVRTVTGMRASLAIILRGVAHFLRLPQTAQTSDELIRKADGIRDQIGKTMAGIRTMNTVIVYEFGVDRRQHQHTGETILRAALTVVALFWNQFAVLHSETDRDFLTEPALQRLRTLLADGMETMAQAVIQRADFAAARAEELIDPSLLTHPRYGEYVQHSIARFDELQSIVAQLRTQP